MEKQLPQPGWRYRHFKGGLYQIVTLALNTETGEDMVVYQALYDDFKVYVRPLSMFLSETDFVKYPDSTQPMRFERIDTDTDTKNDTVVSEDTTEELPDGISPQLMAFLDADSDEERYTILNEMEDVTVNSQKGKKGAPHIVSASFRGVRSEVLLHALEERGIYISAGSACSSNRPAVSATLKAMNIDKDLLESTVRFSFSTLNTIKEIEYCGEQLNSLLPMLRKYVRR